jgi:3-phenylpropionate/cinnamic acid dioxygenase small subunit
MNSFSQAVAERIIQSDGMFLDQRRWEEWLDLFADDAVYWVPAWKDDNEPTTAPDSELSLIYYASRAGLADRVWRLKSGMSVASTPLRRTTHMTSGILAEVSEGEAKAYAAFTVHCFDPKRRTAHSFFGRYDYQFGRRDGDWKIIRKVTILANDQIPSVADFYLL